MPSGERVQNLWRLVGGQRHFEAIEKWLRASSESVRSLGSEREEFSEGSWPYETRVEVRTLEVAAGEGLARVIWREEVCEGAMSWEAELEVSFPLGATSLAALLLECFAAVGVEVDDPAVY